MKASKWKLILLFVKAPFFSLAQLKERNETAYEERCLFSFIANDLTRNTQHMASFYFYRDVNITEQVIWYLTCKEVIDLLLFNGQIL